MRLLFVFSAAALCGGCSLFGDCVPADDLVFFSDVTVEASGVPVADTLTVLFVADAFGQEFVTADLAPAPSGRDILRLTLEGETEAPPRFETVVRGDTVFVREARDLLREACTPGQSPYYNAVGAEAPAGVRHVRVRTVWHEDIAFPVSAPATHTPLFLTA